MKKLSLKNLNLGVNDLLQKQQLKSIFGGYGSGSCGYKSPNGEVWCGLSANQAAAAAANNGGYWCCQSCASNGGSASYC